MAVGPTFLVFGELTFGADAELRELALLTHEPNLKTFLDQATHVIRAEINETPESHLLGAGCSSISELLALHRKGARNVALDQALCHVYHVASFIRHCSIHGGLYPSSPDVYAVGISSGTFAAAVVSHCRSFAELLPASLATIRLAFRAGLSVEGVTRSLESDEHPNGNWQCTLQCSSIAAESIMNRHIDEKSLSQSSKPYISARSSTMSIIGGPPSTLHSLGDEFRSQGISVRQSQAYAPFHASHLYKIGSYEGLLAADLGLEAYPQAFPMISSSNGRLVRTENLYCALKLAISDLYERCIDWSLLSERISYITDCMTGAIPTLHYLGGEADGSFAAQFSSEMDLVTDNQFSRLVDKSGPRNQLEDDQDSKSPSTTMDGKSKIAIVSMSARFPGADSLSQFWDVLSQGKDMCSTVPSSRWSAETHVDHSGGGKNTSATGYGCWLQNADMFDAKFFNISPREAPQVDPAQRIALMTTYEAIEQAGIVPGLTPSTGKDRVGVFYGVTSNDWMETNSAQDIDTYFIPGGNRAFIPGRINYFFKFSGPSYSIDTACSSSLAAIQTACNALWLKDIDTAIAGGTNILTNPDFTAGLDRGHFLSRTGNCKTFDDTADGYCRGEGVGTVILKRLEDALAENDPILGVICDTSTNHNAEAQSITRPCVDAQKQLFEKILNNTNTDPATVDYVEMHGTGTQSGDAGEMESVLDSFALPAADNAKRDSTLHLGAVKANIGHGEAAAGVASLIKVLLMLERNYIPPHCGIRTRVNHKFPVDFESRNVTIPMEKRMWPRPRNMKRRVFLNNFSAAGGNTALLMEDPPIRQETEATDPRASHVVVITAKTPASLRRNTQLFKAYLSENNTDKALLPCLSYTTTARRIHHQHRIAVSGTDIKQIDERLTEALDRGDGSTRPKRPPKYMFAFTGQGSLYAGLAKPFLENNAVFRSYIGQLDTLSTLQGFPSVLGFLSGGGSHQDLTDPVLLQLGLVIFEMALARLWRTWGISPDVVIGHSLGHYSALNAASVLTDADTILLVGRRAQLFRDRCYGDTHSMLAIHSSEENIRPLLTSRSCEFACVNGPSDVVVGSPVENLQALQSSLNNRGVQSKMMSTPYAYHTSQTDPILASFEAIASTVTFHKPSKPILCALTGRIITSEGIIDAKYLADHCRQKVNMVGVLRSAKDRGIVNDDIITIEIGPHSVVCLMVRSILGPQMATIATCQRNTEAWSLITKSLSALFVAGATIAWKEYHRDFKMSHRVVRLPSYSWDLQSYWIQYRNDWSLRKGDPALQHDLLPKPRMPQTTTVHKVVDEDVVNGVGKITTETDLSRTDLQKLVQGHRVNNIPLCTPSIYADLAMTAAKHIINCYTDNDPAIGIDLQDMVVTRALIPHSQGPQLLRAYSEVDVPARLIKCRFASLKNLSGKEINHASCVIRLKNLQEEQKPLDDEIDKARTRLTHLRHEALSGRNFRFRKAMIYKMVAEVAQFDTHYRGLEEILFDNDGFEACGTAFYDGTDANDDFHIHPALMDALSQVAGFVMNTSESTDLSKEVYVNHGWKGFQMFQKLQTGKHYTAHVKMRPLSDTLWGGDVMVFDGDVFVARFESITLQGVTKRALHYILSRDSQRSENASSPHKRDTLPAPPVSNDAHYLPPLQQDHIRVETRNDQRIIDTPKKTTEVPILKAMTNVAPIVQHESSDIIRKALDIIADESGLLKSDLTDDSSFIDVGIDSLLVLILISRFNEELDIELPSSVFLTGTVQDLKDHLSSATIADHQDNSSPMTHTQSESTRSDIDTGASVSNISTSATSDYSDITEASPRPNVSATSVVLQGKLYTGNKIVFMFPDGAGSASSYLSLPPIDKQVTVIGLNSPFCSDPPQMSLYSLRTVVKMYIDEILRRQPNGQYHLAGWSSGGIIAYYATQMLLDQGKSVAQLTLIDSPAPLKGLDHLPPRWYERCISKKLFGNVAPGHQAPAVGTAIERTIAHFRANIELLHDYCAEPLSQASNVATRVIWASEGALTPDEFKEFVANGEASEGLRFLAESRVGRSARGWEHLLPASNLEVDVVTGAHHFSIMRGEYAARLAQILQRSFL